MSPEQVHGAPITPASDVFSLGGVLTFAATGAGPFGDGTAATLLHRVAFGAPDLHRVPPDLRGLVGACLAEDPRARPVPEQVLAAVGPSQPADPWLPAPVAALVGEQQRAARALAATATAVRPVPAVPHRPGAPPLLPAGAPPPPVRPRPRRRGVVAGALALVVVLGVALGVVLTRPRDLDVEAAAAMVEQVARAVDPPEGYERDTERDARRGGPCAVRPVPDPLRLHGAGPAHAVRDARRRRRRPGLRRRRTRLPGVGARRRHHRGGLRPGECAGSLFAEIRARIGECIAAGSRSILEGFRPGSAPRVPGVREQAGFGADFRDVGVLIVFPCQFTRVEAIFLRACAFSRAGDDSGSTADDDKEIGRRAVAVLTELTDAARQAQSG